VFAALMALQGVAQAIRAIGLLTEGGHGAR
jgi:TRAP-type mannitol/chloroaromatic compound transport system permease small subunit